MSVKAIYSFYKFSTGRKVPVSPGFISKRLSWFLVLVMSNYEYSRDGVFRSFIVQFVLLAIIECLSAPFALKFILFKPCYGGLISHLKFEACFGELGKLNE